MASEPRGRSLVVECITIVFGILLAFAIDAAWNSRREREEELRFLAAIDAEIALNLERIEDARVFRKNKQAAAHALLGLAEKPSAEIDAARIDVLIAALALFDVGRWQTDAIDTLLAGGKLTVVEDEALRRQLVMLPPTIAAQFQVEVERVIAELEAGGRREPSFTLTRLAAE